MTRKINRQNARSIAALQKALLELLQEKDFDSINISEIADRSGLTRPTFYAHFDTKQALLESIINEVLDKFFNKVAVIEAQWDYLIDEPESPKLFFQLWKEEKELVDLLKSVDIDCLLLERLKHYWLKDFDRWRFNELPQMNPSLQRYLSSFMAYAIVGFLKEWIGQGMKIPPELMGEITYHFTHAKTLFEGIDKYNELVK